jgi:hypothetical protein
MEADKNNMEYWQIRVSIKLFRILLPALLLSGWIYAMAQPAKVQVDRSALTAWLEASKLHPNDPSLWEAASASTPGGKMAEASRSSFGNLPDTLPKSPSPDRVIALADAIAHWDVEKLNRDVSQLFPPLPDQVAKIYVVANGSEWGDMYQRAFIWKNGTPVLEDHGEPVILLNALLVAATYKGDPGEQARSAYNVVRHELFHVFYARYQASDIRWQRLKYPLTAESKLMVLIQNEGIAHFLADRDVLLQKGFPKEHGEKALRDLESAVIAIREKRATEDLLTKADTGPFWDKYGAISGMLFAYGAEKTFGRQALKNSIQQGPWSLVLMYADAARQQPEFPQPSMVLVNWARSFKDTLPPKLPGNLD